MSGIYESLIELHPTLYHVTFESNRDLILQQGLHSAATLMALCSFSADTQARAQPLKLKCNITLNDQVPMLSDVWKRCKLPSEMLEPAEWMSYLDKYVFFWTHEDRLAGFLKTRRNRGYESIVFKLSTERVIEHFQSSIELSSQNTGGPYRANPTPRELFRKPENFPLRELGKVRRNRREAVVELVLSSTMNRPDLLTEMARSEWPNF